MKTVIVTVGASIFENYFNEDKNKAKRIYYEPLKNKPYSEYEDEKGRIDKLKKAVCKWASGNLNTSAEIKSLIKIYEKLDSKLEVILLTTDSILSNLSSEIIKQYFDNNPNIFIKDTIVIQNMQVKNYNKFVKGRENLIKRIREIVNAKIDSSHKAKDALKEIADNYIFCVSGGYKIIIPTITIISQIYKMKSYYIFENSNDLIENALIPLGFDDFLLEKLYFSIDMLKNQEDHIDNDASKALKDAAFAYNNKVTELGELFYDYVYYNREISRNVLGYFAEYKLYEYFAENGGYKDIKHSYNTNNKELDFVLDGNTIVEVKPMARFLRDSDRIREQIESQIKSYPKYKEHHLYIYTPYKSISNKYRRVAKNIKVMYSKLQEEFTNITFRCFELYWSLKGKNDNRYQEFMKKKLADKDITETNLT